MSVRLRGLEISLVDRSWREVDVSFDYLVGVCRGNDGVVDFGGCGRHDNVNYRELCVTELVPFLGSFGEPFYVSTDDS